MDCLFKFNHLHLNFAGKKSVSRPKTSPSPKNLDILTRKEEMKGEGKKGDQPVKDGAVVNGFGSVYVGVEKKRGIELAKREVDPPQPVKRATFTIGPVETVARAPLKRCKLNTSNLHALLEEDDDLEAFQSRFDEYEEDGFEELRYGYVCDQYSSLSTIIEESEEDLDQA